MSSTIPVIINARAGTVGGVDLATRIAALFLAGGIKADVREASTGEEVDALIRGAIAENPRILVIGGGDGTLSTAAATLAGREITLGILPLGTLNHFAKDLRIPLELEAAVKNIIAGNAIRVDVGEVNDRVFINNSSLGLYPEMVQDRDRKQKRLGHGKLRSLLSASAGAFRRFFFITVRIVVDGKDRRYKTPLLFVGNNEYQLEGFNIGVRDRIDRGQLSICIVKHAGWARLMLFALQTLMGRSRQSRDFESVLVTECLIETRPARLLLATDGEVAAVTSPLRYRIRPRSLSVIVPNAES